MTGWTTAEKATIARAAVAAPSVHNTQPWMLRFRDGNQVSLVERLDRAPRGHDRMISCGAAAEHVRLAVEATGRAADIAFWPDAAHPDEVARLTGAHRAEPSDVDRRWYDAITVRYSHHKPFAARPVRTAPLLDAHGVAGVEVRPVTDADALATLLGRAALVLRADRACQRELSAWTVPAREPLPPATRRVATLVADTLADRLRGEAILVVETPGDGPADHVRAGMAAERIWLAATVAGLVGSLVTRPLHLGDVRADLAESLSSTGYPQLLLRFGHPVGRRT